MTVDQAVAPAPLYHSPWGVLEFQAEGAALCYFRPSKLLLVDTGLGKTHISMATACLLFEDGLIDHVMVAAESDKVSDWVEDFRKFTDLEVLPYKGTQTRREKIRSALPPVFVGTYETLALDSVEFKRNSKGKVNKRAKPLPGALMEALDGKRVMAVYDEITKIRSRTNQYHIAHRFVAETIREQGGKTIGLTATPVEGSEEDYYNLGRVLDPDLVGTVESFEEDHVLARDQMGRIVAVKNISADNHYQPEVTPLVDKMRPLVYRKRKTDPDVMDQFPKIVEEPWIFVTPSKNHLDFMDVVRDTFETGDDHKDRHLFTLMRQIAAHPLSLLRSEGEAAKTIVATVGEEGLAKIGCNKADRFVLDIEALVKGQRAQVVAFTYFGPTVIPILTEMLQALEIDVVTNHAGMSRGDRDESKERFRAGEADVFLSSDAGSRGLNFGNAAYVFHYELPWFYSTFRQRSDRVHRIDSVHPSVTVRGYVSAKTVEEHIAKNMLNRNESSDRVTEDADSEATIISADQRRTMMRLAKRNAR